MDRTLLERKSVAELREIAATLGLKGFQRLKKAELIDLLLRSAAPQEAQEGQVNGSAEVGDDAGRVHQGEGDGDARGDRRRSRGSRAREGREETGPDDRRRRDDAADTRSPDTGKSADRTPDADRAQDAEAPHAAPTGGDGGGNGAAASSGKDAGGDDASARDRKRGRPRGDDKPRGGEDDPDAEVREGVLDLLPEGYGFLRCTGYLAGSQDVYVSQSFVRRFDLRRGDLIAGPIRRNRNSDKFPALARVDRVEG